jgi:hypothetical protein
VRRKYAGGIEPVREFTVDVAKPGEVRPGQATLELGKDGRSFFFVNKEGSQPLPSPDEAADAAAASKMSGAARALTTEDEAMALTAGRSADPVQPAPDQTPNVEEEIPPAARTQAERPAFDQSDVGDSGMDATGSSPRAARLARASQKARDRESLAGSRARAETAASSSSNRPRDVEPEAPKKNRDASKPADAEPETPKKKGGIGGKAAAGAALFGLGLAGREGLNYLAGSEAQASPILGSSSVSDPYQEDTNNSAESVLDRVRQARQYRSYLVSGHMMPR